MTKPRGRHKKQVNEADFVRDPDATMLALAHIKNNENLSWRQLAEEYFPEYTHTLIRKVALGYCRNDEISYALGTKKRPAPVVEVEPCPECGEAHVVEWCTKHGPPAVKGRAPSNRKRRKRYDRLRYEAGYGKEGETAENYMRGKITEYGCRSMRDFVDTLLFLIETKT